MPKIVKLASFWKTEACGQTVLPDSSVFNRQKLLENVILWCVFCSLCKGSRVVTLKPNFTSKCQGKRAKFSPSFWQMVFRILQPGFLLLLASAMCLLDLRKSETTVRNAVTRFFTSFIKKRSEMFVIKRVPHYVDFGTSKNSVMQKLY